MKHGRVLAIIGAFCLTGTGTAQTPAQLQAGCSVAGNRYNEAAAAVRRGIARYMRCLGEGRRRDDCSAQFHQIRSAHSEFELAVYQIRAYCQQR